MGTVNSACLRCDDNQNLTSSIGEPLKGHKISPRTGRNPSKSDNLWTSSTCDMDNNVVQSGGSYSTVSTGRNQNLEVSGSENGNIPSEFVNHGLIVWNQSRQQWVGNKKSETRGTQLHEPRLSWSATYESLLTSNKHFAKPIPLAGMVDFLVDIWEQEGMYD